MISFYAYLLLIYMDTLGKEDRSERMLRVRAKGNRSTELKFRMAITRRGIGGWKMHDRSLPGCPDFVFHEVKLAIFVDGCFWHGCPVSKRPLPVTNRVYWTNKVAYNITRSQQVDAELRSKGFEIMRVWEHSLRSRESVTRLLEELSERLQARNPAVNSSRRRQREHS